MVDLFLALIRYANYEVAIYLTSKQHDVFCSNASYQTSAFASCEPLS